MEPEKKFSPKLYPVDRDITATWFIKYKVKDYAKGKLVPRKYFGRINLFQTVEERESEAASIFELIKNNLPLPNYKGIRQILPDDASVGFAAIIPICEAFVDLNNGLLEPETLKTYRSKVRNFKKWLLDTRKIDKPIGAFDLTDAEDFIKSLRGKGLSGKTVRDHRNLLSSVWDKCMRPEEKKVQTNPWKAINCGKVKHVPFKNYTDELAEIIMKMLPEIDPQLWIALQMVFYCFNRSTELRKLKCEHIDFKRGLIELPESVAKTDARTIVIPLILFKQLIQAGYHRQPKHYYVFSTKMRPGLKMTGKNYFRYRFKLFRKRCGIDARYKFYGAKPTGNKLLRQQRDIDMVDVQMHNGHKSLDYTQHYNSDNRWEDLLKLRDLFPKFGTPANTLRNGENVDLSGLISEIEHNSANDLQQGCPIPDQARDQPLLAPPFAG